MLLLDVSGSMSDWSRALVLFAHAAVRANRSWEAFCFGTRLTRLTRALRTPRPDEALRRAAEAAPDRDAGTRIGESLKTFLDDHGRRGLARGAVVVIASDGLELGDPALLAEQAARLARLAHRVVWLNPLKGDAGLRAAHARHARGAAVRRRARERPQPGEPRSARRPALRAGPLSGDSRARPGRNESRARFRVPRVSLRTP